MREKAGEKILDLTRESALDTSHGEMRILDFSPHLSLWTVRLSYRLLLLLGNVKGVGKTAFAGCVR
jgi:hypothetical protein